MLALRSGLPAEGDGPGQGGCRPVSYVGIGGVGEQVLQDDPPSLLRGVRGPHAPAHGRSSDPHARVGPDGLEVEAINVYAVKPTETFTLANLAPESVHGSQADLAVRVGQRLDNPLPGRVVDDGVIENAKTAMPDQPGGVGEPCRSAGLADSPA